MHFDKKLGLAMGVLLVGIVGAIFFRNEPNLSGDAPRLENPRKIDEQIADKPLVPYLTGVETDDEAIPADKDAPTVDVSSMAAQWEVPPFLRDSAPDPLAANSPAPPDPIRLDPETESQLAVPDHNRAWQAQPSRGIASTPASQRQVLHRVQPGETLSGLAARYLGDATRFEEIFAVNGDVLQSPNDLRPGMMLKIPSKEAATNKSESFDRGPEPPADKTARGTTPAQNVSTLRNIAPAGPVSSNGAAATPVENAAKSAPSRFVPFPRSPLAPPSPNR